MGRRRLGLALFAGILRAALVLVFFGPTLAGLGDSGRWEGTSDLGLKFVSSGGKSLPVSTVNYLLVDGLHLFNALYDQMHSLCAAR